MCLCGHRLVEHDETGRCRPVLMIGASQGMGPIVLKECECRWPTPRGAAVPPSPDPAAG